MALRCKRCGSEEHVKNGFMKGLQRYRCKACGLNFTDTPPRGMPLRDQLGVGRPVVRAVETGVPTLRARQQPAQGGGVTTPALPVNHSP